MIPPYLTVLAGIGAFSLICLVIFICTKIEGFVDKVNSTKRKLKWFKEDVKSSNDSLSERIEILTDNAKVINKRLDKLEKGKKKCKKN